MKEHPHAELLRAIADGVPLSEFEASWCSGRWSEVESLDFFWEPNNWRIRRKPQYIMVNCFKVPKPLDKYTIDDYFIADPTDELLYAECRNRDDSCDKTWLNRGIAYTTKEAAIAHAKAMLGIDPEYFK